MVIVIPELNSIGVSSEIQASECQLGDLPLWTKSGCAGAVTVVVLPLTWNSEDGARYALVEVRYTGDSSILSLTLRCCRRGAGVADVRLP